MDGGIAGLLGLIASHRGAVEYDWRTRFGLALSDIGTRITLTEAARITHELTSEPTSHTYAAVAGWSHPWSPEARLLADLFDAYGLGRFKKPKPYPRPWDAQPTRKGRTGGRSRAEVVAILNAHGHSLTA